MASGVTEISDFTALQIFLPTSIFQINQEKGHWRLATHRAVHFFLQLLNVKLGRLNLIPAVLKRSPDLRLLWISDSNCPWILFSGFFTTNFLCGQSEPWRQVGIRLDLSARPGHHLHNLPVSCFSVWRGDVEDTRQT